MEDGHSWPSCLHDDRRARVPILRKQAVDDVRPEARSLREIGQWDVFPNGVTNGTASIGSSNGKSIRLII